MLLFAYLLPCGLCLSEVILASLFLRISDCLIFLIALLVDTGSDKHVTQISFKPLELSGECKLHCRNLKCFRK